MLQEYCAFVLTRLLLPDPALLGSPVSALCCHSQVIRRSLTVNVTYRDSRLSKTTTFKLLKVAPEGTKHLECSANGVILIMGLLGRDQ